MQAARQNHCTLNYNSHNSSSYLNSQKRKLIQPQNNVLSCRTRPIYSVQVRVAISLYEVRVIRSYQYIQDTCVTVEGISFI
jgi:hypothetical protein